MNRFTFLKHIQPLDAHDYNYENGKKKEKEKNIQSTTFWNRCNNAKHFEN